jgi:NAD(P)-dependent dehydrogenase (short-subunit alcohol dehydrogenase family)
MRFKGKKVLVTGGTKGIGWATAQLFAKEGASVALLARDSSLGSQCLQALRAQGAEALFLKADVASWDELEKAFAQLRSLWGQLHILVNNAGIYAQGYVEDTSPEVWERILKVNLTGAFYCIKLALPLMHPGGSIVNVASEAGLVGIPNQVAYNVSKSGLIALTKSCAVDLAPRGIRVNAVAPGTTWTPLVEQAVERSPDPEAARRELEVKRPLGRLGRPEEVAAAILCLASDEMGYATGAVLCVDGGFTAW